MSYITLQIGADGAIFDAYLGVSRARQDALKAASQPVPNTIKVRALLDTGASCTCVHPSFPAALGLTPSGNAELYTVSTGDDPEEFDEYDVSLLVINPTATVAPVIHAFHAMPLYFSTIKMVGTKALEKLGCDVLVGRDILESCMFVYDGKNSTLLLAY